MRTSIRANRSRLLALAASALVAGTALAAATMPAQAVDSPAVNTITVSNPDPNYPAALVEPTQTAFDLPVTVTETGAAQLVLTVTAEGVLPLGSTLKVSQLPAPGGGAVDVTGTISGVYTGNVTVTAKAGMASGSITFPLKAANTVTVDSPGAQVGTIGKALAAPLPTVTATDTDALAKITFSANGTLPPGLAINPTTGVISGKPTGAAKTYAVVITATDSMGATGTADISWKIGKPNSIVISATLPKIIYHGVATSVTVHVADSDKAQKTFKWGVANLPNGMTAKASGATLVIAGRPSVDKLFSTVVTAKDATGATGTFPIRFDVTNAIAVVDLDPRLTTSTVGHGTIVDFTTKDALKGEKITKFAASGLPPGMYLSQSPAMIYGWPTKGGKYKMTIEAFGSLGSTDSLRNLPLTVKGAPATGTTGQIHLALDGKCLQAPKGAKVEITNCIAGGTEKWTIASDGTIRIGGHCLGISGSSSYSGKGVQLATCNGSPRELWAQGSKGQLVDPSSKLCLTDRGASRSNGIVPVMGGCTGKSYQEWTVAGQQVQTMLGACADDYHSSGSNGARVDNYGCNGTVAQTWLFEPDGTIHAGQYHGDCLTTHKGLVQLYACQKGSKSQQWAVIGTGGIGSELMQAGACVALPKLTAAPTTALVTMKCSAANPRDLWHIW